MAPGSCLRLATPRQARFPVIAWELRLPIPLLRGARQSSHTGIPLLAPRSNVLNIPPESNSVFGRNRNIRDRIQFPPLLAPPIGGCHACAQDIRGRCLSGLAACSQARGLGARVEARIALVAFDRGPQRAKQSRECHRQNDDQDRDQGNHESHHGFNMAWFAWVVSESMVKTLFKTLRFNGLHICK